jgi:hypothetical protein
MSFLKLQLFLSAMSTEQPHDAEGAAPVEAAGDIKSDESIASFEKLARLHAEQEVRQTVMPHIATVFMMGHPYTEFSANDRITPHIAAILKDKGFTTEPTDKAPSPPGMPPRRGLRVYLHAKPGDPLPKPDTPKKKQKK